jgi:hypothetical protein
MNTRICSHWLSTGRDTSALCRESVKRCERTPLMDIFFQFESISASAISWGRDTSISQSVLQCFTLCSCRCTARRACALGDVRLGACQGCQRRPSSCSCLSEPSKHRACNATLRPFGHLITAGSLFSSHRTPYLCPLTPGLPVSTRQRAGMLWPAAGALAARVLQSNGTSSAMSAQQASATVEDAYGAQLVNRSSGAFCLSPNLVRTLTGRVALAAALACLFYDILLTFSDEIRFIWSCVIYFTLIALALTIPVADQVHLKSSGSFSWSGTSLS